MHSAGDHHSFNYENVAVSYQHIYGKHYPLIAPNIGEPATIQYNTKFIYTVGNTKQYNISYE